MKHLFALVAFIGFAITVLPTRSEEGFQQIFENYKKKFPFQVCLSPAYLACYPGENTKSCVEEMFSNYEGCNEPLSDDIGPHDVELANENYQKYTKCMFHKHAGIDLEAEIDEDSCLAKAAIDMRAMKAKMETLDQEWVNEIMSKH